METFVKQRQPRERMCPLATELVTTEQAPLVDVASRVVDLIFAQAAKRATKGEKIHGTSDLDLTPELLSALTALMERAGFEPKEVVWENGYLRCVLRESRVKRPHPDFANAWFKAILKIILEEARRTHPVALTPITIVLTHLERIQPFERLLLNADGHYLLDHSPSRRWEENPLTADLLRDATPLLPADRAGTIGIHAYCGGSFARRAQTEQHDALICNQCFRAFPFPHETATYGALRSYCLRFI